MFTFAIENLYFTLENFHSLLCMNYFQLSFSNRKVKALKLLQKKKTFRNFHLSRKLVFQSIESILEDFSESVNNVWNITDSRNI